eukprot:TRINITY_DN12158_c0_g1_i1.p3 TRINITY_DN12158_c0_g1~~TRINITY_DN12158_c0_g1_i1.p3  ORF type:complete len:109 (+),score=14.69 TRINITY_DN12158_c0_g1_i1:56-382(+)
MFFFSWPRRHPRFTLSSSSAASDVYKRQKKNCFSCFDIGLCITMLQIKQFFFLKRFRIFALIQIFLSLIHISEPTRQAENSYAVFCFKKKKKPEATFKYYTSEQACAI